MVSKSAQSLQELEMIMNQAQTLGAAAEANPAAGGIAPTGNVASSLEQLEAISANTPDDNALPEGTGLQASADVAIGLGNAILSAPVQGILGLIAAPIIGVDEAVALIEGMQRAGQDLSAPETERGRKALQDLGKVIQAGEVIVRSPFAGVAGLSELAGGGGLDSATEITEDVLHKGYGPTFGDMLFDSGASPEVATIVSVLPQATLDIVGLKGAGRAAQAAKPITKQAGQRLSDGVNNIIKNLLDEPEIRFLDENGKITPDGLKVIEEIESLGGDVTKLDNEIAKQLSTEGILSPEEAKRFNLFKARGIQPIRSQITQKGEDFIISQELAKGTNPISQILASQDGRLEELARQGKEALGGTTIDKTGTSSNIFQAIDNVIGSHEKLVTAAYEAAKDMTGPEKIIRLDTFLGELKKNVGNESISGGLISSVRQDLINKGVISKNDKTFKGLGRINGEVAEQIRQGLNAKMSPTTPERNMIIHDLKEKLDIDVEDAIGSDIFADARAAKIELERIKRKQKRDQRDKSKSTFVEKILDNSIPEEDIYSKLRNVRDDEFLSMKDLLLNESGPQGIQAWQNFKTQIFSDAIDKAIGTRAKIEGGGRGFKGNLFANQFNDLKGSKKFEEIFNADEIALIDDIAEIDYLRVPKSGTYSGKGPSAVKIAELEGTVMDISDRQKLTLQILNLATAGNAKRFPFLNAQALKAKAEIKAKKMQEKVTKEEVDKQIDITKETEAAAVALKKQQKKDAKKGKSKAQQAADEESDALVDDKTIIEGDE